WNYQHDSLSSRSVVVQKRFAVDQRPQQILRSRGASAARLQVLHATRKLGGGGRPAERSQVQFGDHVAVWTAAEDRLRDSSVAIRYCVRNGSAVHQIQRLRQAEIAAAFALARRFARRPAEQVEEAVLADVRVRHLPGLRI